MRPVNPYANILWWAFYIVCGVILQQQLPGMDCLTPGFLLALQERSRRQVFWLFILFTLIQEGTGSLTFGMGLLWYGGQIALFRISARLFVADNILFVFMLSLSAGALRGLLIWFMCALQDIPVEYMLLFKESLLQALVIPILWGLFYLLRRKMLRRYAY